MLLPSGFSYQSDLMREPWPVPPSAGGGLLEDAQTAGSAQRLGLQCIALLVSFGNARVAEQHAPAGFHKRPFAHRIAVPRISTGICFHNPVSELSRMAIGL